MTSGRQFQMSQTLMAQFTGAARALKTRMEQAFGHLGLHAGQQFILECLWGADGLTPGKLARRIGVETPTVVKAVQRMEAAGLVERRPHPTDARLVTVHLTERGRALEALVPPLVLQVAEEALSGFSAAERAQLESLLERLRRNLSPQRHPVGATPAEPVAVPGGGAGRGG